MDLDLNAHFADGRWAASTGERYTLKDPSTGELSGSVTATSVVETESAIAAARRAFDAGPWPKMTLAERAEVLRRMSDLLNAHRDELIDLIVEETGCPIKWAAIAQVGFPLEMFANLSSIIVPSVNRDQSMAPFAIEGVGLGQGLVTSEPIGVAALLTAFNFPLALNLYKLGPALAAGCTVVLKPSPFTPRSALVLARLAEEVGVPPGVVNVVVGGADIGQCLTESPSVDLVSFTGSEAIGKKVYEQASRGLKRVVLELGGKSPNLLLDDCNLDKAAPAVVANFTIHSGQGCSLLTRTLVHHSLQAELTERVREIASELVIGDPRDPATDIGPVMNERQLENIEAFVASGLVEGATALVGGRRVSGRPGYYFEPTFFVDATNNMKVAREEVFGPVGVLLTFDDDDHAVSIANDSPYGLAAAVWCYDPARALSVGRRLRTGYVDLNGGGPPLSPFGGFGGIKKSGFGREWGYEGIAEFQVRKTITWGAASG